MPLAKVCPESKPALMQYADATMPVCTPTHAPCWIEAQTLIDRIQAFADIEAIPLYDFQIALNRVVIDEHRADMTALSGESAAIFHYLFSEKPLKLSHIKHPGYWVSAILRRRREEDGALFAQAFIREDTRLNILNPPRWLPTRAISAYSNRKRFDERHFDIFVNPKKLMVQKKRTLLKTPFDSLYKHLEQIRCLPAVGRVQSPHLDSDSTGTYPVHIDRS